MTHPTINVRATKNTAIRIQSQDLGGLFVTISHHSSTAAGLYYRWTRRREPISRVRSAAPYRLSIGIEDDHIRDQTIPTPFTPRLDAAVRADLIQCTGK
jgi:hypothetical protein